MGLQEKQAWAAVNPQIKESQETLAEAAGAPIAIVIEEPSFGTKDLIEYIPTAVLGHLAAGFADLCSDSLAKEAVQTSVKRVMVANKATDQFAMKLDDCTLHVEGNFDPNGMSGLQYPHANDYKKFLTENL